TPFKRVTSPCPTQRLGERRQRSGVPEIAGDANRGAAGTGKGVVDYVIWKQDRKLIDRNTIHLRQEVESCFGIRSGFLVGGIPVKRCNPAPPLEFVQQCRRKRRGQL